MAELLGRLRPSAHDAGAPTLYPGLGAESLSAFGAAWRAFVAAVLASEGEAVLAVPDMQPRAGWPPRDDGFDPLEVRWSVRGRTSVAAVRERFAELERIRSASRPPESGPVAGPEMPF